MRPSCAGWYGTPTVRPQMVGTSLRGMPDVEQNLSVWADGYDWSRRGDEWSKWWGGTEAMWRAALLPRIHAFLPAGTILEIAPGYGRWTQFLKGQADRLVVVDLAEKCIDHCRMRFEGASNIEYHVNDGRSLEMVADGSVDFAFSFDSLVHVERDVIEAYVEELASKLKPNGVAFLHHSNAGAYRRRARVARRLPRRLLPGLIRRGVVIDVIAWRAETMTADVFAAACERVGLSCVSQECISWEHGNQLIDTLSTFTPRGSTWDRPRVVVRNPAFRDEGARARRLYSVSSFPRQPDRRT